MHVNGMASGLDHQHASSLPVVTRIGEASELNSDSTDEARSCERVAADQMQLHSAQPSEGARQLGGVAHLDGLWQASVPAFGSRTSREI